MEMDDTREEFRLTQYRYT